MTIKCIKLVGKKEFVAVAINLEYETFVFYVLFFNFTPLDTGVHLSCKSLIANLIAKNALTKVLVKYADFANVFFLDWASKLLKHTKINNYYIKLFDGHKLYYGPIYCLKLVKIEILKAYIERNLPTIH